MVSLARSGWKWRNVSGRSRRQLAFRRTRRCQLQIGRGCGLRWPGSSSSPSMAGSRLMRGSWRDRSRRTRGRGHRRFAGFDLTFSPVKSVSTLWAVAEPAVTAVIERAHHAAVKDALAFIEKQALFTRTGPQGIRQVNVRGLVGTAFTHRDSRAGDPDLRTHVAVANKVQTLDGSWLSIDGRVLFKANGAASETYNTALEQHLHDTLGVRFAERPGADPAKRPRLSRGDGAHGYNRGYIQPARPRRPGGKHALIRPNSVGLARFELATP
jgi:TrwC relaxase